MSYITNAEVKRGSTPIWGQIADISTSRHDIQCSAKRWVTVTGCVNAVGKDRQK